MKCEKCGGKKLQVISEYRKTSQKKGRHVFMILHTALIICLFACFIAMISETSSSSNNHVDLLDIPKAVFALKGIIFSLAGLFLSFILELLIPYQHETKTKVVCMDCGHSWELKEPATSTPEEKEVKEENKN